MILIARAWSPRYSDVSVKFASGTGRSQVVRPRGISLYWKIG